MASGRRGGRLWSSLSPSYRARLRRQGIGREEWLAGADLRRVRGHAPRPPDWRAPSGETARLVAGEATLQDVRTLQAWDRNDRPDWLTAPFGMSWETAAALSQVGIPVERWGEVDLVPSGSGPWTMVVTPSNHLGTDAYDITVIFLGGSLAKEVLDFLIENDVSFTVHGTP